MESTKKDVEYSGVKLINIERIQELLVDSNTHVRIDKYELDVEFTKQPCLYNRYSHVQADLEEEKCTLCAELHKQIRKEFLTTNKKAPSEAFVTSTVEDNERYIELTYYINRMKGILKSLEQKRSSLEKLADLARAGYYSTPRQPV